MTMLHGALIDVHGVGVLLLGASGIGKSECALELVSRGHRLVADDVVELEAGPDGRAIGRAPKRVRHYMEIRGLGIIFVPDLFGPERVRDEMSVDLICHVERWREGVEYDRLGLERTTEDVAGAKVAALTLPARPGASMATIVDVAAREHRQRRAGVNAARRLDAEVRREMQRS
jgi:HPr kinase/phosphorylase